MRALGLGIVLGLSAALGCGGGSSPITLGTTSVSVAITPVSASLHTGGTQLFAATVTGSSNQAVTWGVVEAAGGSISAAGLYTAPALAGSFHVQATSGLHHAPGHC